MATNGFHFQPDIASSLAPWRHHLGREFDDVVAHLTDRDRQLEDFLNGAPWTPYAPTLTQLGDVTHTVTAARYTKVGRLVVAQVYLAISGSGATAGNNVIIGLPVTAATATFQTIGQGWLVDASAGLRYKGTVEIASSSTVFMRPTNTTTTGALGGDTFTAALASGDELNFTATYESAS